MELIILLALFFALTAVISAIFFILSGVSSKLYSRIGKFDFKATPIKTLFSKKYLVAGRPDGILGSAPLEYKSASAEAPYEGHAMQLMSYCLLLEEQGEKPEKGFLQYNDNLFEIYYTDEMRKKLINSLGEMREMINNYKTGVGA